MSASDTTSAFVGGTLKNGTSGLRGHRSEQFGARSPPATLVCESCLEAFASEGQLEVHRRSPSLCEERVQKTMEEDEKTHLVHGAQAQPTITNGHTQSTNTSAAQDKGFVSPATPRSMLHESKTVEWAPRTNINQPELSAFFRGDVPFDEVDQVVHFLSEVEKAVRDYRSYVHLQQQSGKPLYRWPSCSDYKVIRRTVGHLDSALSRLNGYQGLPKHFLATLYEARRHSTATSKDIADVLAIINKKTESYVFEQENYLMSEEDKAIANALMTVEVQQILEHCTLVSTGAWAAIDRLQGLYDAATPPPKSASGWKSKLATAFFSAAVSASIGLAASYFVNSQFPNIALKDTGEAASYAQIMEVVQQNVAVTNITSQTQDTMLSSMEQRYQDLSSLTEAHGLRIDNLVEALGPPNELGVYFTSGPIAEQSEHKVTEGPPLDHLLRELKALRNNVNRMDMRLTADVKRLRKGRM